MPEMRFYTEESIRKGGFKYTLLFGGESRGITRHEAARLAKHRLHRAEILAWIGEEQTITLPSNKRIVVER